MLEGYTIGLPEAGFDADGLTDPSQHVPLLNCVANQVLGYYGNCMVMPFSIPASLAVPRRWTTWRCWPPWAAASRSSRGPCWSIRPPTRWPLRDPRRRPPSRSGWLRARSTAARRFRRRAGWRCAPRVPRWSRTPRPRAAMPRSRRRCRPPAGSIRLRWPLRARPAHGARRRGGRQSSARRGASRSGQRRAGGLPPESTRPQRTPVFSQAGSNQRSASPS